MKTATTNPVTGLVALFASVADIAPCMKRVMAALRARRRRSFIGRASLCPACFCVVAIGGSVQADDLRLGNMKADKILFLGMSIIEVFANDRQAAVASHKYAPENLAVGLFSNGGETTVKELKGWKMKSIYPSKPDGSEKVEGK